MATSPDDVSRYRARAARIVDALIGAYPVPQVARTGFTDGRKHAEAVEKRWAATLPDSFAVDGRTYVLLTGRGDRFWANLLLVDAEAYADPAASLAGRVYPVNIKSGAGRTRDNVAGASPYRYLFTGEIGRRTSAPPRITEKELAGRIRAVRQGDTRLDGTARDYFCLYLDPDGGSTRLVPFLAVAPDHITVNKDNGPQMCARTAAFDAALPIDACLTQLVGQFSELLYRRAEAALELFGWEQSGPSV